MLKGWSVPLLLVGLLAGACAGGPRNEPRARPTRATAPASAAGAPEPPPIEAGLPPDDGAYAEGIDILHYRIELTLPDEGHEIEGRARIALRRTSPGAARAVLDLTGLAVDSVRTTEAAAGGWTTVDPRAWQAGLVEGKLAVPLPGGSEGDTLHAEVFYRGVPDDGLVLGRTVHGRPSAFADNWPNRARFWFPGVDHPSDKATVEFVVHAPPGRQVVANGARTPDLEQDGGDPVAGGEAPGTARSEPGLRTWRWRTGVPIPTYTMVVGATDFATRRVGLAACGRAPASPRDDGCIEVTTWLYPEDTARAMPSFRRSAEMVDYFTATVGPFPYEKMAHVQSATRFGGMENASAIFYSEEALAGGRDVEGTVSHETAHQWFGDAVTEAAWPHLWLSEGFATYFGALFFEHADGPEALRRRLEEDRREYLWSGMSSRPVVDTAVTDLFDLLNANSYEKGGWVLHMLRGVVGDEVFFRGVRAYYRRHRHGTVLTRDFRAAMEKAAGRDLGWFFRQWLFEPGHPRISVSTSWDPAATEAVITLRQRQPASWPTFRLPAQIEVVGPDGEPLRQRVELSERTEVVRIALPGPPRSVRFDPDGWILMEPAGAAGGRP